MDDPAEPGPLSPLEELLVAAADDPTDQGATSRFLAALLGSTVGVVVDRSGRETTGILTVAQGGEGRSAIAFTHRARYDRWLARTGIGGDDVVGYPVRDLFSALVGDHASLLLDPESSYGKSFTPIEMSDALAGIPPGTVTRVVQEETRIKLGTPAHVPPGMIERLRAHCLRVPGVSRAALAWVAYPDGLKGYLLEVVAPDREAFLDGVSDAIGGAGGRSCDVIVSHGEPEYTGNFEPFFVATQTGQED